MATLTGFRAGSVVVDLNSGQSFTFNRDVTLGEAGLSETTESTNNWDAFLVYKHGGASGSSTPWSLSLGAGMYRDTEAATSKFSGFATASVGIFRGLGIDASYWYVGGSKQTAARQELAGLLDAAVADNLSRFTIGVGYTFN